MLLKQIFCYLYINSVTYSKRYYPFLFTKNYFPFLNDVFKIRLVDLCFVNL